MSFGSSLPFSKFTLSLLISFVPYIFSNAIPSKIV